LNPFQLDDRTWVIYLQVPGPQVVLFQALFENYEGLGIVRTLDIRTSRVCLLTTGSMLPDCMTALENIRGLVPWRFLTDDEFSGFRDGSFLLQEDDD